MPGLVTHIGAPMNLKPAKRTIAAGAVVLSMAALLPMALAAPAEAKSCKWTQISYDPVTHVSVVACIGRDRP